MMQCVANRDASSGVRVGQSEGLPEVREGHRATHARARTHTEPSGAMCEAHSSLMVH